MAFGLNAIRIHRVTGETNGTSLRATLFGDPGGDDRADTAGVDSHLHHCGGVDSDMDREAVARDGHLRNERRIAIYDSSSFGRTIGLAADIAPD